MHNLGARKSEKELVIKLSTEELSDKQVRLIKTINSLLTHVLTADEEGEYFEASAALLKQVATAVNQSNFSTNHNNMDYGTQAVEFAVDTLNETLEGKALINIDN
jgi:hypothetical protein